jgi:serine/threonine-protein kinase HipA
LNGKKKKIRSKDFPEALNRFDIEDKSIENMFHKFQASLTNWYKFIEISFLPDDMKKAYHELIESRANQTEHLIPGVYQILFPAKRVMA